MQSLIENVFKAEEQIEVFKKLVQIPSENPGHLEEEIALEVKRILESENIETEIKYVDSNRANVYAFLRGEEPGKTLLYNGHLDTVPVGENWKYGPFSAFEDEGGNIYGRGAADMKSGVAAMLYATICLKRMGYPKKGNLILFLNADEEVSNLGMKQFLMEDFSVDYAIISEPSDLNICIGHKGVSRYKITTRGKAEHAAFAEKPKNAIEKMNKILDALFKYSVDIRKEKQHDFLGKATSNVTVIDGGLTTNIIPDECSIIVDRRIIPGETEQSIVDEYHEIIKAGAPNIDYELETLTFVPPSMLDEDHELVQNVYEVLKKDKEDVQIKDFEATCEAPFFSVEKNIPTIIYGPGRLSQAHNIDEHVHRLQVIFAGKSFINICLKLLDH